LNITHNKISYKINVVCENPFVIAFGKVYGITPPADINLLPKLKKKYAPVFKKFKASVVRNTTEKVEEIKRWKIKSKRTGETYVVRLKEGKWHCACKGYTFRGTCKHITECKGKYNE